MEAMAKTFVLLLLCCFCTGGNASSYEQCKLSDLEVTQAAMPGPAVVGGHREHVVAVTNWCACSQTNVKLACPGFNPSVRVYPEGLLTMDGDGKLCTLNVPSVGTGPGVVMFSYSWKSQISFQPVSSTTIACGAPAPSPQ